MPPECVKSGSRRASSSVALAGAPADELYDATGGNAFFVTEAIAAGGELPPPSVRDAVLARVGQLAAGARTTLELVAVVPGAAELWLVRQAGAAAVKPGPAPKLPYGEPPP